MAVFGGRAVVGAVFNSMSVGGQTTCTGQVECKAERKGRSRAGARSWRPASRAAGVFAASLFHPPTSTIYIYIALKSRLEVLALLHVLDMLTLVHSSRS